MDDACLVANVVNDVTFVVLLWLWCTSCALALTVLCMEIFYLISLRLLCDVVVVHTLGLVVLSLALVHIVRSSLGMDGCWQSHAFCNVVA